MYFAHHPGPLPLHDAEGQPPIPPCTPRLDRGGSIGDQPKLPSNLIPLGAISLSDELRPEAGSTLKAFAEANIQLKIISGDNPDTVAALARQAGWRGDARAISGLELAEMDEARFAKAATEASIFGRITPEQKEELVRALRGKGYYVAMIGDGVNDVLSLKQAQIGIAMQSGSQATRGVADMVLLDDSFAALPRAFQEGQRIIRGMQDIVRLFLTRTFYLTLLIIASRIVGLAFPVTPKHNSLLALLTVGIPTLALAAWARPGPAPKSLLRSVSHFVFPAAFSVAGLSLAVYLYYLLTTGSPKMARTALTMVTVLCGLVLIPFVEPPTPAWVGGDEFSGDWRPTLLALGMLLLFALVMLLPPLRRFFELEGLRALDYLLICALVAGWGFALRFVWRARLFEKLVTPER